MAVQSVAGKKEATTEEKTSKVGERPHSASEKDRELSSLTGANHPPNQILCFTQESHM